MSSSTQAPISNSVDGHPRQALLPLHVTWVPLRILTPGQLNPWIAPAVRGLVLQPLRDRLCLLDQQQQNERRSALKDPRQERYCRDCQRMIECAYGQAFEPDRLILGGNVVRGAREGLRGTTFATFGVDNGVEPAAGNASEKRSVTAGEPITLRILQVGQAAKYLRATILECLDERGKAKGLGPDHVRFQLEMDDVLDVPWSLDTESLPLALGHGSVPLLRIHLDTPLMLKRPATKTNRDSRQRRSYTDAANDPPNFAAVFRESLRTLRRAINEYTDNHWAQDVDWRDFFHAADQVETQHDELEPFHQARSSARQEKRWQTSGWQGAIIAFNVPVGIIPYLQWAGRLGIGDSRNCGAGLFHLRLG